MAAQLSDQAKTRFTGNVAQYLHMARYRQVVFLKRNIDTVLAHNLATNEYEGSRLASLAASDGAADGVAAKVRQQRPRVGIAEVVSRLSPSAPGLGKEMSVLKIEAKSLKRKRQIRPTGSDTGATPPSGRIAFRCRCEIAIYDKRSAQQPPRKSRSDGPRELYRSNEFCTLTYVEDDKATIVMDEPFYIRSNKLYVHTGRGQYKRFGLADCLEAEFALEPIDPSSPWPPLVADDPILAGCWDDPWDVTLVAKISGLPTAPSAKLQELWFRAGSHPDQRADMAMELDCKWNRSRHSRTRAAGRLPTPNSDSALEQAPGPTVLTGYRFASTTDEPKFGEPNPRGEQTFCIPGYTCPFCDGHEFRNQTFLHFHFVTAHDLFQFRVKQRKPTPGIRSNNVHYDIYVDVYVDLAKDVYVNRASNMLPDIRHFKWTKPRRDFDITRILKGDWSWLNEKKGILTVGARSGRDARADSAQPPAEIVDRKLDLDNVKDIPPRKRKTYIVPQPLVRAPPGETVNPNLVFIRSKSKRFIRPGEEVNESDDDVDEYWLQRKHDETVEDFEDISTEEKQFMKLWDRHMFAERPTGYVHVPHSLVRFARQHGPLILRKNLLLEFWKHCLNFVQYGVIDAVCMRKAMEIVKGGEDQWSYFGKTKAAIGPGSIRLDKQAELKVRPRTKSKSKAGVNSKEMENEEDQIKVEDEEREEGAGDEEEEEEEGYGEGGSENGSLDSQGRPKTVRSKRGKRAGHVKIRRGEGSDGQEREVDMMSIDSDENSEDPDRTESEADSDAENSGDEEIREKEGEGRDGNEVMADAVAEQVRAEAGADEDEVMANVDGAEDEKEAKVGKDGAGTTSTVAAAATPSTSPKRRANFGICICQKSYGWHRPDIVRCDGRNCSRRWFHRSCFNLEQRWVETWLCPDCAEREESERKGFRVPDLLT